MKEESFRFVVRLPISLRDRIAEASRLYRRSMNSEIVTRLGRALEGIPDTRNEGNLEPPFFEQIETTFRGELSNREDQLVRSYRRLSERQKDALLGLLGG